MPGRWKYERDRERERQRKVKLEFRKKYERVTSLVLGIEHVDFLQRKSEECTVRLGKVVNNSHIIRALIRRAMDEDQEKGKVWNEKDLV